MVSMVIAAARDATPAMPAASRARRRNHSARSSSPRRSASKVSSTAARNAVTSTASTPPTIDRGPVHDVSGSPPPSTGTRPEAMAPAMVPRKNGVTTDDEAKTAPWSWACA